MGAHVLDQAARLRHGHAARSAGVWAVARMGADVSLQAAGCRECHAASGADVGAVARMGAHVCRQAAGLRAGLAAEGALENEFPLRPTPPLLAWSGSAPARTFSICFFPPPLASVHLPISWHRVLAALHYDGSGQTEKST